IFYINIFSTTYLVDASIEVVGVEPTQQTTSGSIYIKTGNGGLSGVILSGDKRNISATYTKDINDSDVDLVLAVHYGDDATTKLTTLSFNVNSLATNGDVINTYTAGQVKLGNGDGSQIYIPAGALDASGEGNLEVNIEKSDMEPGTLQGNSASKIASMGVFAGSVVTALPNG
ncbi:MAG: hypothetical protein GTO18_15160, partial [Anaerolineales bacterium]|nr:hypothetical protein [Anaerolineales bacterium]